jgi:hypothetical protein
LSGWRAAGASDYRRIDKEGLMEHGEFRVGDALSKGFSIWFRNLPSFLFLSILIYSPIIVYTAVILNAEITEASINRWGWVVTLGEIPLDLILTGGVLYGTIQQLRGQHAGIGESIGVGLKRLLPVLGVGILMGLCVFGGLILLLVPGVIIYCMLYVSIPAAVVERPGVAGALGRSRELTAGNRLGIFGIVVVLWVIQFIVTKLLQSVFITADVTFTDIKVYLWLSVGVGIVLAALSATINGVVYHDLRVAKDGVETEDLARVFE